MPRRPVGTQPQQLSATALAAYIASRLAGLRSDRELRDQWLEHELRLKLRSNGLDRAAPRARAATRPWLLIDEWQLPLALDKALVVFPGAGRRRPPLLRQLAELGVARQILVTRSRRDVLCVLLYRRSERDALFAAIEALDEPFLWDDVLEEERLLEAEAWAALVRRVARDESLLSTDG